MSFRWAIPLCVLWLGTGCSTPRLVRLDTGQDSFVVTPREESGAEVDAAELSDEEFAATVVELARDVRPFRHPMQEARALFGVPARSGVYRYEHPSGRLIPQVARGDEGPRLLESYADDELTRAYGQWCVGKHLPGDCLRLLDEGPLLASDGKYALAMAIAMDSVWQETADALAGMADADSLLATVTAAVSMYMLLWAMPEPFSKGVAALITASAIAYLGVDTVWRLLDGWLSLVREVEQARSFEQLSDAGERYGTVLGENAARVFVMLATAAIGSTVGLAAQSARLPGSAQAALAVESQAGYAYSAVGGVRSVALSAEGFTVALAPHAVAMAGQGMSGGGTGRRLQRHHLATNKNEVSASRGGPWTPEFRRLFRKAGMELKDHENVVDVPGHRGPHPQRYHEIVFERLREAMEGCRKVAECRRALTIELGKLATEVTTKGTELHRLVTHGR